MSTRNNLVFPGCLILALITGSCAQVPATGTRETPRERISINSGWRFYRYDSTANADSLIYDIRPDVLDRRDDRVADSRPGEAVKVERTKDVLKAWILPSGNDFIKDPGKRCVRPEGDPGSDFPFVRNDFDDSDWETVDLPHDWAIDGPFLEGPDAAVGGGMGRLPVRGVAWYRKELDIPESDTGRSEFLQVDGAMSYAMVWLNGHLVGGWPYGYNSWRLDLTPYIVPGGENQLAIRLDNPPYSARWYPGGGIYRNAWLIRTHPVHVGQWGTYITTRNVSAASATVNIEVMIDNDSQTDATLEVATRIFALGPEYNAGGDTRHRKSGALEYHTSRDREYRKKGDAVAMCSPVEIRIGAGKSGKATGSVILEDPMLWGPPPTQKPDMYVAVTTLSSGGHTFDTYETRFGIRSLGFDPDRGILVNGEHIPVKGVNQHHDLGALGAAFSVRAAERQLELLREMGCNAIRTAHNPPAPELLELTDRMGFLVMDEIFDVWKRKKTPLDFHLIFPQWYEQDTRAFIRRDRNHPSVIIWSFGNEVGEQYTGEEGAAMAQELEDIIREEDPARLSTASMNFAKPGMAMPGVMEVISLNYQGEGIRDAPAYAHLRGITTPPLYSAFHEAYPGKVILSTETASTMGSRGTFLFPVFEGISAPVRDGYGGDPGNQYVSAYGLYTAAFGSSPDKVFAAQDKNPYVAGEFVWTGWDYLGEPTPYYSSRSSYSGIIDLAGFKKDRFYLYQSRWRPDLPMAHILPHWNWPERMGEITPVHVFTSGDEAELFLNGESVGRRKKGRFEYRLRWDSVRYEPGELQVVAYKDGNRWAEDVVKTTGKPAGLQATADRRTINADGRDLAFVTVKVVDKDGLVVPGTDHLIGFGIEGPGEIVATDNGDPTDMVPFPSQTRKAFNGLALVVVRSRAGDPGMITVTAGSEGLKEDEIRIHSR